MKNSHTQELKEEESLFEYFLIPCKTHPNKKMEFLWLDTQEYICAWCFVQQKLTYEDVLVCDSDYHWNEAAKKLYSKILALIGDK